MLKVRLARAGRKKRPFFRVVLTEHTKPVHAGYQEVLGWYDPIKHTMEVDVDAIKGWFTKGARPSNRMAKLLYKHTNDEYFKDFIVYTERKRTKKKEDKE